MKFLVTGEYIDAGALMPPDKVVEIVENIVAPSMDAMAKLEVEGKILAGGVAAGKRAGCFIADVSSNDELSTLLQGLPFWGLLKWDITPLQSFGDRAAQDRQHVEAMKSTL